PGAAKSRLNSETPASVINYNYPNLPITKHREELISLVESNSVIIVRGATGSGKSTQLPQFILDHHTQRSAYCNIVVTQPRKIGASSIARWISKNRNWPLGSLVGYQVSLEKVATNDTRLIYTTTGVLLQKLVSAKTLTEFTHIFIDEVHERTDEMDFLLLIVRKLLQTNSRFVKVILMSATINCKEFADYFAVPFLNRLNPAYVFEVEGTPYDIEEYYLENLKHVTRVQKSEEQIIETPPLEKDLYQFSHELRLVYMDLLRWWRGMNEKKSSSFIAHRGSVLIFLPGLAEINYLHELLTNVVHNRLQVYPLHSSVTLDEQNDVFLTPVPGYRKIILSTNIAESSVTVPDVKYVIDFCLTRTLVCDEDTNYQSLRLTWASKTSCNQRKGRAGRVSKGYYYRLISQDFWMQYIPENAIPEMLRCPLGSIVLKVKLLDMGEPRALLATALSPPNLKDIERTVLQLKEVGALSVNVKRELENPHDGELTFLGRVLAQLPVDLQLGKLIVLGHVFGCLEECLVIAAGLSLRNFFAMPYKQHLDGYRSKMTFSENTLSDCIALVNAFKAWHTCRQRGELRHPKKREILREKLVASFLSQMINVAELFEDLKNRVQQFNMHVGFHQPGKDHEYRYKQQFILQVGMQMFPYPFWFFTFASRQSHLPTKEKINDCRFVFQLKNLPTYGFLYYKHIQGLFRQCGQVKAISFDGTRAYVEFSRIPTERSRILPAVYMALKMAQLRMPLELSVHLSEEIEAKVERGNITRLKQIRVNADFQRQTVDPVDSLSDQSELSQRYSSCFFTINVTEVVEVGHFWGYKIDDKSMHILRNLTAEVNQQQLLPLTTRPRPDLVCLAPFTDSDEKRYYRAKILYVSGDDAEVFFVDYGNTAKVNSSLLRNIPALEFQICKMRPSAKSLICGDLWSAGARLKFFSLVNSCALVVRVYSIVHNVLRVDLCRISGQQEINIRDVLIRDGHAELAEESYESKVDHSILSGMVMKSLNILTLHTIPFETQIQEKSLMEATIFKFFQNQINLDPIASQAVLGKFINRDISCIWGISPNRSVWIERESINSVAMNDAVENQCQRILVAASVSVNASGSAMLLRDTTLMPDVHGLPALICMLFAPILELRTDRKATRFTGALCGLGWNPATNSPLLEDHDIELAFEKQFEVDDIVEINILRSTINKLICEGPNGSLNLGQERICQLQENTRQKLLDLFIKSKSREMITPQWYEKPYQWNQVDPGLLVDQSRQQNEKGKKGILYQLHQLVLLNA
uniref:ATP-dependent RNA helicase TDRD9 n=1 Tax=Latimeria chalumnae TaxID=7897 RepID=H2ZYQ6_LATCH